MLAGGERSFWSPCTSPHAPGVSPARCFRAWVLSVDSSRVQSGECQMRSGPGGRGLRRRCNRFDQYSILGELFRRWDPHCRNKSETPFQLGYYAQCPHRGTRHGPRWASPLAPQSVPPFALLRLYLLIIHPALAPPAWPWPRSPCARVRTANRPGTAHTRPGPRRAPARRTSAPHTPAAGQRDPDAAGAGQRRDGKTRAPSVPRKHQTPHIEGRKGHICTYYVHIILDF